MPGTVSSVGLAVLRMALAVLRMPFAGGLSRSGAGPSRAAGRATVGGEEGWGLFAPSVAGAGAKPVGLGAVTSLTPVTGAARSGALRSAGPVRGGAGSTFA